MIFVFIKEILIIILCIKTLLFVKASASNRLDQSNTPNTTIERFTFTYSTYDLETEGIERDFLRNYYFTALSDQKNQDFILLTIEPTNEFIISESKINQKIEFIDLVKNFIIDSRKNGLDYQTNKIFTENGCKISFENYNNKARSFRKKIETSIRKHTETIKYSQSKHNTLKIFDKQKSRINTAKKFSDTHIFFINVDASYDDLSFYYDSILMLNLLISDKQKLPSFNLTLLSKCNYFLNEISDFNKMTIVLLLFGYYFEEYNNLYEITIISNKTILFKQRLLGSKAKSTFLKIKNI
ncbi:hypothetical protein GVAV_001713 [Gurleya vavrai]